MLGLINDGVRSFIIDTYGADAWGTVVDATGVEKSYVTACPYPDEITYKALGMLANQKGLSFPDVLDEFGYYFCMSYVPKKGYERLLRCMGGSLIEFFRNLNVYHLHLSMTFKDMRPPAFNVDEITPESLVFHYSSTRPGLTRLAMGLIRGATKLLYNTDVEISILNMQGECGGCSTGDGNVDGGGGEGGDGVYGSGDGGGGGGGNDALGETEGGVTATFLIRFPPQDSVVQMNCAAATARLALDPPTFFQLFPFHMVVDTEGRLVQVGWALSRMYPAMKPGRLLTDFFTLRHPYIPCTFKRMLDHPDNVFVFRSCINGMELKGQMQYMQMPTGTAKGQSVDASTRPDLVRTPSAAHWTDAPKLNTCGHEPAMAAMMGLQSTLVPSSVAAAVAALGYVAEEAAGSYTSSYGLKAPSEDAQDLDVAARSLSFTTPNKRPSSSSSSYRLLASHPNTPTRPAGAVTAATGGCPHLSAITSANASGISAATSAAGSFTSTANRIGGFCGPTAPGPAALHAPLINQLPSHCPGSRRSSHSSNGGVGWTNQRNYQRMHPGTDVEPVLVFLGSPRIGNVEELRTYGLYVSDLPLFDHSREMVLMAEQRTAEAALKDTFERLSLQLEEERQRSDQLLYQMIPRHIADSLRRGERVNAETYPEATILFSDIVNFTTIAAGSTAMEVCTMLDALYNEFDALIDKYPALYKVETIGDAYMLVANVTEPCPSHVDVVLDFALDMQTVCNRVTTNMGAPIQIRVGIHTGSVVGGVVGRKMPRFHLFGDAVNTASRMESHGLAGAVHISAASRALITNPSKYLITERGEIAVKGKGLMETFLVSRADAPSVAHIRSILAASTSPEYAIQVVPVVPPPTIAQPLHHLTAINSSSVVEVLSHSTAPSQPRLPFSNLSDMDSATSKIYLGTAQLQALANNSSAGDSIVGASIGGAVTAVSGHNNAGGDRLSAMLLSEPTESGRESSVPLDFQMETSLDLALALTAHTPAPVVPSARFFRSGHSQVLHEPPSPQQQPPATTSLQHQLSQQLQLQTQQRYSPPLPPVSPILPPPMPSQPPPQPPPLQQMLQDEVQESLLPQALHDNLQYLDQPQQLQRPPPQQQQQQQHRRYQAPFRTAVQATPEHLLLRHRNDFRSCMQRSYSSVAELGEDHVPSRVTAAAARSVRHTTTFHGFSSAASTSPTVSAGQVPYSPLSGANDSGLMIPASSSTNSNINTPPTTRLNSSSTRRRVLLAAGRPRRPSFYLRANIGPGSHSQIDLTELEAILQNRVTDDNTNSGQETTSPASSPRIQTSFCTQNQLLSVNQSASAAAIKVGTAAAAAAAAAAVARMASQDLQLHTSELQLESSSQDVDTAGMAATERRPEVAPRQPQPQPGFSPGQQPRQRQPPAQTARPSGNVAAPSGDSSLSGVQEMHGEEVRVQLRQRSFLADAAMLRSQLQLQLQLLQPCQQQQLNCVVAIFQHPCVFMF